MTVKRWLPMVGSLFLLHAAAGVGMGSRGLGLTTARTGDLGSVAAARSLVGQVDTPAAGSAATPGTANPTDFWGHMTNLRTLLNEQSENMKRDEDVIQAAERGRVAYSQGTPAGYQQAEIAYQEAVGLKPMQPSYHYCLANARLAQGKYPEAETSYLEAVRLGPAEPSYQYALANTRLELGKYPEAEASYREALNRANDVAAYHYGLGSALLAEQGRRGRDGVS